MMEKYDFLIKSKIFNCDNKIKNLDIFKELNIIWNWFKHQSNNKDFDIKNIYKKENIYKYFNEINNIYKKVSKTIRFGKMINKINDYIDEIDGLLNPLGLTGFEID